MLLVKRHVCNGRSGFYKTATPSAVQNYKASGWSGRSETRADGNAETISFLYIADIQSDSTSGTNACGIELLITLIHVFPSLTPMIDLYLKQCEEARLYVLACAEQKKDVSVQEGAWSAYDVLEHCLLVERSICGIILKAPSIATACEAKSDAELEQERAMIMATVPKREQRYEAAERLRPQGRYAYDELCTQLAASRDSFLRAVERRSDAEMRSLVFAHAIRGDLTLYGWVYFAACHELRHAEQILQMG